MKSWSTKIWQDLTRIRNDKPLIHNITNFVVMNSTANVILCVGASPVMAHCVDEAAEMVSHAGALVLNIGTLTPDWVTAMIVAGKAANRKDVPVVLDPVGAGATKLRTDAALKIIKEVRVSVIRGNGAEILALAGAQTQIRGVDSLLDPESAGAAAKQLAAALNTVLAITGPIDLVTDGKNVLRVANGHPLLTSITGTGCAATTVVACFAAVGVDPLEAAAEGLAYFGLAGELAGRVARGPGSFQVALYDSLAAMDELSLQEGIRIIS